MIPYNRPVSTPKEDLTPTKLHCNNLLLTLDIKYLIVDVKNLYLKISVNKKNYHKIPISLIPQDILDNYDLV